MDPHSLLPATSDEKDNKPPGAFTNSGTFFMEDGVLLAVYPDYFTKILPPKLQQFYTQNGHRHLIEELFVKVISDLDECKQLWHEFSPKRTLFDTWEFRLAFWKGYPCQPYFLILKNSENLALLPLWYEEKKKKYFWFGSWWQEENSFLVKDPVLIPLLMAVAPTPMHLNAITGEEVLRSKQWFKFKADDPKYVLDLRGWNGVDDFLATLKKKRRYNLKRDRRLIEAMTPEIMFDRWSDFDTLVSLSKKRFKQKGEDTDWEDPGRVKQFRHVIRLGRKNLSYKVRMITVKIGRRIAAVDLVAIYNDCYYPLKCGYDVKGFPGIGNYVNLLEIQDAINLGLDKIDFLEIGYGWKDKWFTSVPLFKYDKK